jgi:hypothetical protein
LNERNKSVKSNQKENEGAKISIDNKHSQKKEEKIYILQDKNKIKEQW